jgi:lysophospholipase L1-like esterase
MMNHKQHYIINFICYFFILGMGLPLPHSQGSDLSTDSCIAIVGDSLAQGRQVIQLPGVNYFQIDTVSFAHVLDQLLNERRYYHLGLYDLTMPASGLVSADIYTYTREYDFLLSTRCRFVVIFPWINDLFATVSDTGVEVYRTAITRMVRAIHNASNRTQIVLMNYYFAALTDAGKATYLSELTPEHVHTLNIYHENLCDLLDYLTCFDTESLLFPIEDYVSITIDLEEYQSFEYQSIDINVQAIIYQQLRSGQILYADGIHLNIEGKRRLADHLTEHIEIIDPNIRFAIFSED